MSPIKGWRLADTLAERVAEYEALQRYETSHTGTGGGPALVDAVRDYETAADMVQRRLDPHRSAFPWADPEATGGSLPAPYVPGPGLRARQGRGIAIALAREQVEREIVAKRIAKLEAEIERLRLTTNKRRRRAALLAVAGS